MWGWTRMQPLVHLNPPYNKWHLWALLTRHLWSHHDRPMRTKLRLWTIRKLKRVVTNQDGQHRLCNKGIHADQLHRTHHEKEKRKLSPWTPTAQNFFPNTSSAQTRMLTSSCTPEPPPSCRLGVPPQRITIVPGQTWPHLVPIQPRTCWC